MTYYGNNYGGSIPEAPDIRKQRPRLFNKGQSEFPTNFAMPQDVQPYDVGDPSSQLPDLWPEIQQELRGILEQGPGKFYTAPEGGGELTPEQQEHNKMLMAWKSPAGLSAIETGKYRVSQEKARDIERAENRVANYGKQLAAAFKMDDAPRGLIQQLEKSYNASVSNLDKLLGEGQESGHGKYTGKGKFELAGMEKESGLFGRGLDAVKDWVLGDSQGGPGLPRGQESPLGPGEPDEMQPGPEFGVGDASEQAGKVFIKGLLKLDKIFADTFGNEKAKALTDKIVKGSQDPGDRLEKALATLPAKAQKNPEVQELQRQLTVQRMQMPGWSSDMTPERKMQQAGGPPPGQTADSMPVLRQFQRNIPQPGGG